MTTRRNFLKASAAASASAGLLTSTAAAEQPVQTLKTAHPGASTSIWGGTMSKWTNEFFERYGDGRFELQEFWSNSLIPYKDHYRGIERGILDFGYINLGLTPGQFPVHEFIQLPGIAPKLAQGAYLLAEMEKRYPEEFQSQYSDDIHMLGSWQFALADLHTVEAEVRSLEDIRGLRLGVQNESVAEAIGAMGGSPSVIPWTDFGPQLERGVIDGIVAAWGVMQITGSYEFAKNHTLLRMFPNMSVFFINSAVWNSLDEGGKAFFEHMVPYLAFANNHGLGVTSKTMRDREITESNGHKNFALSDSDLTTIRGSFRPIWDNWVQTVNDRGMDGQKMLDDAIYLSELYSYE